MSTEIADSDQDSDFEPFFPNHRISTPQLDGANEAEIQPILTPGVDFDQFLSPTQRLSLVSSDHVDSDRQATGSTDRLLEGIAVAQRVLNGDSSTNPTDGSADTNPSAMPTKKRRHTDLEDNLTFSEHPTQKDEPVKRRKTYGDRLRERMIDNEKFSTITGQDYATTLENSSNEDSSIHQNRHVLPVEKDHPTTSTLQRERDRPRRVVSLLQQANGYPGHSLSTSHASMGSYQSLNLDFRGSNQSIDTHANPFGSISQMSQDTDAGGADYHVDAPIGREINGHGSKFDETRNFIDPEVLHLPAMEANHGTDINHEPLPTIEATVDVGHRSERKKSKTLRHKSKSSVLQPSDDLMNDELGDDHVERSRKIVPRPTVEPLSQSSQLESSQTTKKSKSRNLRDQSRNTTPIPVHQESSPMKAPNSDLHLSDPAMIGAPKEMYKPRPSRSRSNKIADEEVKDAADANDFTPEHDLGADDVLQNEPTPSKPVKKSAKKSKVKRAKTSAAALLKRSQQMLSDGEEDVLWLDSKPPPVKLDLPPEIKPTKKEEPTTGEDGLKCKQTIEQQHEATLMIEIPLLNSTTSETQKPVPEPKKRGRPKKSAQTVSEADENLGETVEPSHGRRPLVEKDANIHITKASNSIGENQINKSADKQTLADEEDDDVNQENSHSNLNGNSHQSPQKATTPRPVHSPIKPSPTPSIPGYMNTKYRIGLSRRLNIPSLLRKVDKVRAATPVKIATTKKGKDKSKKGGDDVADGGDNDGNHDADETPGNGVSLRDQYGNLIAWED